MQGSNSTPRPGFVGLSHGRPELKGCSEGPSAGTFNFALDAPDSGSAFLELILPQGHESLAVLGAVAGTRICVRLEPAKHRTSGTWHVEIALPFRAEGIRYAWLLDPALDAAGEKPLDSAWRIIDPCAKALDTAHAKRWNHRGGTKYSPLAVIPDHRAIQDFDWQGVKKPPGRHLKELIIYEAHVRGFTRNPDSQVSELAGTFLAFIEKIPHLVKLGINCVELLPVFEFDETACPRKNPQNGDQLCNYWGYSSVNFMVPMQRFASGEEPGASTLEFKVMVRELHRQGIEVILDVAFSHTGEGSWGENFWHSLAAIAKPRYYLLNKGADTNYTGGWNTVNANDPLCSDWIITCLRFWVEEMHVDGFRFDGAAALTRGSDGEVLGDPLLIRKMTSDPVLKRTKLIAEPWDCVPADGYLVGKFPSCGEPRFAEWNGTFCDTVRKFIKGDEGTKGDFATRICGSPDLFKHNGRGPFHSINYITAHDSFTLRDLVTYNCEHNTCNGDEDEESGENQNNSWNCGWEGETSDSGIQHMRNKQIKNCLCALFLSAGTPMIVFGDEYGRSQKGCNDGWCQDALSWFSWSDCEKEEANLVRYTRLLIALRKRHSQILMRDNFMADKDIWWRANWQDPYNYLCFVLHDDQGGKGSSGLLVAFNAGDQFRDCDLPADRTWHRLVDTNLGAPADICDNEQAAVKITSSAYSMAPYSCIVLKTFGDTKQMVLAVELSAARARQEAHGITWMQTRWRVENTFYGDVERAEEEEEGSARRRSGRRRSQSQDRRVEQQTGTGSQAQTMQAALGKFWRIHKYKNAANNVDKPIHEMKLQEQDVAAGSAKHAALVFIKLHAVTDQVKDLVKEKLAEAGITVISERGIAAQQKPDQLVVQPQAQEEFKTLFGLEWPDALAKGLVFNVVDGAALLSITPVQLGKKYNALKKGTDIIMLGGGFYCGRVDGIYIINNFYLSMRSKFTAPGTSIYFYEVEWPADKLKWADFRGKVLGPTDPATAPEGSLRGLILSKWEELGLKVQPDTGDNGVHGSASPFEALAERVNWLGASIFQDLFGKALLSSGVPVETLEAWFDNPAVEFEGGKHSLFDLLEDLDADEVLKKCTAIAAAKA